MEGRSAAFQRRRCELGTTQCGEVLLLRTKDAKPGFEPPLINQSTPGNVLSVASPLADKQPRGRWQQQDPTRGTLTRAFGRGAFALPRVADRGRGVNLGLVAPREGPEFDPVTPTKCPMRQLCRVASYRGK